MPVTISTVHVAAVLTNVSQSYRNSGYIADRLFPVVPVAKETGVFFVYGKDSFKRIKTERALGAVSEEYDFGLTTDTYQCDEYSLLSVLDNRILKNQDSPLDLQVDTTEQLVDAIMLDWEKRVATLVGTAANFASDHTVDLSSVGVTRQWDAASETMQKDVQDGIRVVRRSIGKWPNTIVISPDVAEVMSRDSDILDQVKYTHAELLVNDAAGGYLLPPRLWGLEVLVPTVVENTANLGQTESMSDVWSDQVLICYVEPRPGIKKCSIGYTFRAQNFITNVIEVPLRKSRAVEVSTVQDEKVVAYDAGYLIDDVLV